MKTAAYITMITSSMMAISSSNMMLMWIMLEMNSMSFIFTMKKSTEAENMIKYFMIQASGSIPIMMSMSFMLMNKMNNMMEMMTPMAEMIMLSMMMKMGAAPFHLWMIMITKKMGWSSMMIMITIQKMTPIILTGMIKKNNLIMMFLILSSTMGTIPMMTTSKTKTILTMSTTNHTSWMLMAEMLSKKMSMIYMMIYMTIVMPMMIWTKKNKMHNINMQENQEMKSEMNVYMLSMAGIPPTSGFLPKMMVIMMMMKKTSKTMLMSTTLIISSILSVYAYMRMIFKSMTITKKNSKMSKKNQTMKMATMQMLFFPITMMMMISM